MTEQDPTGIRYESENFPLQALESVVEAWDGETDDNGNIFQLKEEDLFVVWFAFVMGNWKALVSTHVVSNTYWEVTYNRAEGVTYVDHYVKHDHIILEDSDDV